MRSIRQPEYTGENRCVPCTVLNLVIAVAVSSLLAAFGSLLLGAAVLLASIAVIYLRGYLVPGTPRLTARYLPDEALRLFGKEPRSSSGFQLKESGQLTAMEIVVPCDEKAPDEAACLDADFRTAWRERVDSTRPEDVERADIADLLGVEADSVSSLGEHAVVTGSLLVRWPSTAALVADVAAGTVLEDRSEAWRHLSPERREETLTRLRAFLSRCPACGEPLSRGTEEVDSCCQPSQTVFSSVCDHCDAHLVELEVPKTE
ncbi:hypothetical protein [Haladaptatus sp. DYF46]|uniref:hypothetical protein n=1 Tax=Haladaptatus sp. DYF46 TaxID=2886041 RepID=UPI001E5BAAD4|nr:hypothetical protein [Haladaptatus sp. DYF46]